MAKPRLEHHYFSVLSSSSDPRHRGDLTCAADVQRRRLTGIVELGGAAAGTASWREAAPAGGCGWLAGWELLAGGGGGGGGCCLCWV